MASVRDLKKDINYVLGDIIEAVYFWEASNGKKTTKEGSDLIDEAIAVFDDLIVKVNQNVENRSKHLKAVKAELEEKATSLVEKLNKLG
ncbi:hypothetical protein KO500_16710 [Cellulophaga baltica]|uniref:hypothetical protein n=1 Tax=Cellulophaga TaxID=104264 RepID=UPI001C07A4E3|nr:MULTISPECIES: hypothetical protein [Cellulophaga]MBU2998085.1 hypothetical protein [Cellulophaga baltica]MDO6769487.1 hypothetical protein [Cellulophaga sp. 1_MG-2023]